MRSSRVAILVALVALLVLASPAAAVERRAHHRAHHRHAPTPIVSPHHHSHHRSHEVEEHEAAAPASAAEEEHEEKSYADEREAEFGPGDLGNFQAELMRFAQAQVQDSPVVEAAKANDVFRKMYNVMAGFRDKEAKETSQVQKAVVAEQQKQAELIEQAKALKAKNEALTRLQYCLEKDTSGAAATSAVRNAAAADASAQLQKKQGELDALKKQLDEMKATLDQRTAQLEDREAKIKSREDLLQQHLDKLKMSLAQLEGREVKAAAAEVAAVKALTGAQAQCSAGCAAKLSCGQCTADPKCGWCSTTSTCLDVTKADELNKCPTAADLNVFYCKDETCEQHTGCQSCMSDPRCGFCGTNGKCMNGTLAGPAVGQCFSWNYDDGMRFLSLNIYGRDITNVSSRATAIFKLLEDSQADFIALQEVEDWFLKALDAQPFAAKYYKSDFGSGHAPGGLFILSRLPLDSVAYVEKTAPGQVEVDQRGRMLVVTPRLGRGNLQIATTTLDWRSPEARADNLDFVFSNVNTTQQVVVMGDFNFDHNAQPETSRVPLAFRDLWSEVHPTQPGFTWDPASNSYARLSDPRSRPSRIDRMFVSSGFVDLRRVALVGGSSVSPHFGLLGDVQLFAAYC